MTEAIKTMTPQELQRQLQTTGDETVLLDVRTPGEFTEAHIPGVVNIPLPDLGSQIATLRGSKQPLVLVCKSGGRARKAHEVLRNAGVESCVVLEGGTDGWMQAGLPVVVNTGKSTGLPIMRQVQIVVGFCGLLGAVLALTVHPLWALLPAAVGLGLLFAGLTGICGLAIFLAYMPWNRGQICGTSCSR
jgi:rhodanese-related sulfurtransferase